MNLRFEYLYRDAGNFKKWGDIIFSNTMSISVELVEKLIISKLDEKLYFKAADLNIPDLHGLEYNPSLDHIWHEFHCCKATNDPVSDINQRDIQTVLCKLSALSKEGAYPIH